MARRRKQQPPGESRQRRSARDWAWRGALALTATILGYSSVTGSLARVNPSAPETQSEGLEDVGRTADTGIGEVGERTEGVINREPLGRLQSRIPNRVQNRIRNRLDRSYDPTATATAPFNRADQQTRRSGPGAPQ